MRSNRSPNTAFTLVELLVVIAIVAILAAIGVANFLEAQTRAKVSRVKADMRTLFVALEAYATDCKEYPCPLNKPPIFPDDIFLSDVFELTTPVAYLSSVDVMDPFKPRWESYCKGSPSISPPPPGWKPCYTYYNMSSHGAFWRMLSSFSSSADFQPFDGCMIMSVGPDRDRNGITNLPFFAVSGRGAEGVNCIYDPTNGTNSSGDIGRWNGRPSYYGAF